MVRVKRVYDPVVSSDGARFLVERLWPRGMKKKSLVMDAWLKEIAPSDSLRQWFNHDPAKWDEFKRRYRAELDKNFDALKPLYVAMKHGAVTLLFSAHDFEHNNAVALKLYLESHFKK